MIIVSLSLMQSWQVSFFFVCFSFYYWHLLNASVPKGLKRFNLYNVRAY